MENGGGGIIASASGFIGISLGNINRLFRYAVGVPEP